MNFDRQIEFGRRRLLTDLFHRLETALRPFHEALDAFLGDLFQARLPADWRQRYHTFTAQQTAVGFRIHSDSVRELEAWIEAWAAYCGLSPSTFEPEAEEGDRPFVISVIPEVSGPGGNQSSNKVSSRGPVPPTKSRFPADGRGTWLSGVKGEGAFQYNDSPLNRQRGLVGKKVYFVDGYIAVGGFPPEAYYQGSASRARVYIKKVTGTDTDNAAADAAMRKKLNNPRWQRPQNYRWNHAGRPGSTALELVDNAFHEAVAHKGPAAPIRKQSKAGRSGTVSLAVNVLTVYLVARDALQAAGALQPDYEVLSSFTYEFEAQDGSRFIVIPGMIFSATIEFIDGERKGQIVKITDAKVDEYRRAAEKRWGRYVPGSLFRQPKFIPGTERKRIPYIEYKGNVPVEAGWIDENGVHRYPPYLEWGA